MANVMAMSTRRSTQPFRTQVSSPSATKPKLAAGSFSPIVKSGIFQLLLKLKWLAKVPWNGVLHWVVGISQVVLVVFAWVTIKFTLVPLYGMAVLQDKADELTLNIKGLKGEQETLIRDTLRLKQALDGAKQEATDTVALLKAMRMDLDLAKNAAQVAEKDKTTAQQRAADAETARAESLTKRDEVYKILRKEASWALTQQVSSCVWRTTDWARTRGEDSVKMEPCFSAEAGSAIPLKEHLHPEDVALFEAAVQRGLKQWAPKWETQYAWIAKAIKQARVAQAEQPPVNTAANYTEWRNSPTWVISDLIDRRVGEEERLLRDLQDLLDFTQSSPQTSLPASSPSSPS